MNPQLLPALEIPVLGIPHYNRPDLTARCIASIDFPVAKLVLVFNQPSLPQEDFKLIATTITKCRHIEKFVFIFHPNAGVAGAWNEIVKLFPAPWWLITNNDIEFAPGDLARMATTVTERQASNRADVGMFYGNHGASWFGLTAFGVGEVGLFDENIYPAYLEDCDWAYRADLLGVPRVTVDGLRARHGEVAADGTPITGSCTIMSDPEARANNGRTHGRNFEYYRAKWGGINEQEQFKTPFNDPHWPVWAWRFDPAFRRGNQWS